MAAAYGDSQAGVLAASSGMYVLLHIDNSQYHRRRRRHICRYFFRIHHPLFLRYALVSVHEVSQDILACIYERFILERP